MDVQSILLEGEKNAKENQSLAKRLKRSKPKNLDATVHQLHDVVFEEIDCLTCANCCKTTSPGMHYMDIERLSKHLKIKAVDLIAQHMEMDNDGEFVFRSAPCPFLGHDNYCSVYKARPSACREFPHTNRKRFYQILDLSLKNTEVCPAVVKIFEGMKKEIT